MTFAFGTPSAEELDDLIEHYRVAPVGTAVGRGGLVRDDVGDLVAEIRRLRGESGRLARKLEQRHKALSAIQEQIRNIKRRNRRLLRERDLLKKPGDGVILGALQVAQEDADRLAALLYRQGALFDAEVRAALDAHRALVDP